MPETRVYPVKSPEIVAQEQAAYTAKIDSNFSSVSIKYSPKSLNSGEHMY